MNAVREIPGLINIWISEAIKTKIPVFTNADQQIPKIPPREPNDRQK